MSKESAMNEELIDLREDIAALRKDLENERVDSER